MSVVGLIADIRRLDAEGLVVAVRWLVVALLVLTAGSGLPQAVEPLAWAAVATYAAATAALTAWWVRSARATLGERRGRLGAASLAVDTALASAVAWLFASDPQTPIFAVPYLVTLEAAFRCGRRGAFGAAAVLGIVYLARGEWASERLAADPPAGSAIFVGVGFLIAAIAGAMAERYEREHRRLVAALATEREAAAALRSLDELRSTFLAAVSHEMRTPLTSILGFSMTLQDRAAELAPSHRSMLDQVVDESQRLAQLLEDLLDVERTGRGGVAVHRSQADLVHLVRQVSERVGSRFGRQFEVQATGEVLAAVDARKVDRIVENLLDNAVQYSPPEGRISLRVERSGGGVLMAVDDEGPGVPEALRASIFAPFERGAVTTAHQPGTGIGLALVDRFARLHGGRAWVEDASRDRRSGASFRVYLPDGSEGVSIATVAGQSWNRGGGSSQARSFAASGTRRLGAVAAVAMLVGVPALAYADVLPRTAQRFVSSAAALVGVDVPAPSTAPGRGKRPPAAEAPTPPAAVEGREVVPKARRPAAPRAAGATARPDTGERPSRHGASAGRAASPRVVPRGNPARPAASPPHEARGGASST